MLGVFPIAHGGKGDLKITLSFSLLGGDKKPLRLSSALAGGVEAKPGGALLLGSRGQRGEPKQRLGTSTLSGRRPQLQGLCLLVMGNRRSAACPVNRLALQ